jgi:hypothetical protein
MTAAAPTGGNIAHPGAPQKSPVRFVKVHRAVSATRVVAVASYTHNTVSEDLAHGIVEPGELALGTTSDNTTALGSGRGEAAAISAAASASSSEATFDAAGGNTASWNGAAANASAHAAVVKASSIDAAIAGDFADVASPEARHAGLSRTALALTQVPLGDAAVTSTSLRAFALSAQDQTGTPFFKDTIRNLLMNPKGVQFGGIAGLNWSGASATGTAGKVSGKTLTGLTLGIFADVPLKKHLSIRPRAQYAYQGYQPDVSGQRVNIHVAYLNMSSNLVYHTDWLQKRFFVGAGPYMAYAMSGTYTLKGINTDMVFGNNYAAGDNLRKMDYGASLTTGCLMDRNFVLGAGFDMGLQNIAPRGFSTRIHTRSAGVSIMYVFGNRPLF